MAAIVHIAVWHDKRASIVGDLMVRRRSMQVRLVDDSIALIFLHVLFGLIRLKWKSTACVRALAIFF